MECICWGPCNLEKMSDYYHMNCTPNTSFENKRVNPKARYDFEMKLERKVRGHQYYRQRYYKGKIHNTRTCKI